MAKKQSLLRLTSIAYDTPHLITTYSLDKLLTYLEARNTGLMLPMQMDDGEGEDEIDDMDDMEDGVAYIKVDGAITYQPVYGACGEVKGCSYKGLLECVDDAAEAGMKIIVMDFSTPGGQASHAFEYAEEIRKICDDNEIELIAYVDECACSAGYLLACICDEVIANPDSITGSIGAVVALTDVSKAMEQAGVKRIYITSGDSKVPYAEDGSFKSEFINKIQEDVDALNTRFAAHVEKYTGISASDIKDLNAETFNADEALSKGLVNKIMTNSEFVAYVAAKYNSNKLGAM